MAMGLKIIREMSKEEIIDELLASQREVMERTELDHLKRHLIQFRVAQVQQRLAEEADLEPGFFSGLLGTGEDEG